MSTLLVDIGNTRVKWAVLRGARVSRVRAVAHGGRPAGLGALVHKAPREITAVMAVCVAGMKFERALRAAVRTRFGVRVSFLRSTRSAAGVRNGYRDVWRLGADRWSAVIAAHALGRLRPVLVANIGTALTLDAVEFLRRLMLHVPPRGFHRLRHFGFLANRVRQEKLAQCRTLLGHATPPRVRDEAANREAPEVPALPSLARPPLPSRVDARRAGATERRR